VNKKERKSYQSRSATGRPGRFGEPYGYTPSPYIETARAVLGEIDLDPATSKVAQKTVTMALHDAARMPRFEESFVTNTKRGFTCSKRQFYLPKLIGAGLGCNGRARMGSTQTLPRQRCIFECLVR